MTEAALTIPFSNPSAAAGSDCLKIEQEPWGKDVGQVSNVQGILAISASIYGKRWPQAFCGGLNGVSRATVFVYPCADIGLNYQFKVSHGEVIQQAIEVGYREETIQCSMKLEHEPDYPVMFMGAMAWIGHCYDSRGTITGRPVVSFADGKIVFSKKVYGSVRIRYTAMRHAYQVQISRRQDAIENKYQSVAYAVWNGGIKWIDIDPPARFEEFDGDCGNGAFYHPLLQDGYGDGQLSGTDICLGKYTKLPVAVTADRHIVVNYCSQEQISDKTTESAEYETTRDECD